MACFGDFLTLSSVVTNIDDVADRSWRMHLHPESPSSCPIPRYSDYAWALRQYERLVIYSEGRIA